MNNNKKVIYDIIYEMVFNELSGSFKYHVISFVRCACGGRPRRDNEKLTLN